MSSPNGRTATQKLFSDLVWPAVAGNVAWSVVTCALEFSPQGDAGTRAPVTSESVGRLMTLIVIAAYLFVDWWRTVGSNRVHLPLAWRFDTPFALALAALAIGVQTRSQWASWALFVVLVSAAWGHFEKAWGDDEDYDVLCGANGLGAAGALIVCLCLESPEWHSEWWRFCVVVAVFGLWLILRWRVLRALLPKKKDA